MRHAARTTALCACLLALALVGRATAQERLPATEQVITAPDQRPAQVLDGTWLVNRGRTKIANWQHYSSISDMNVIEFTGWMDAYLGEQQGFELRVDGTRVAITMSDQWSQPLIGELVPVTAERWRIAGCFPASWEVLLRREEGQLRLEGLEIHALVLERGDPVAKR